jgi:hypothetical protein
MSSSPQGKPIYPKSREKYTLPDLPKDVARRKFEETLALLENDGIKIAEGPGPHDCCHYAFVFNLETRMHNQWGGVIGAHLFHTSGGYREGFELTVTAKAPSLARAYLSRIEDIVRKK